MDTSAIPIDPRALAGPLTAIAAAGAAITILTEAIKQYCSPRVPPPLIAALVALAFTLAMALSQDMSVTRHDAFPLLMTWVGLFQVSIGVYHGAKLAMGAAKKDPDSEKLIALHESYARLLAAKDRQLAEQKLLLSSPPPPPAHSDPNVFVGPA